MGKQIKQSSFVTLQSWTSKAEWRLLIKKKSLFLIFIIYSHKELVQFLFICFQIWSSSFIPRTVSSFLLPTVTHAQLTTYTTHTSICEKKRARPAASIQTGKWTHAAEPSDALLSHISRHASTQISLATHYRLDVGRGSVTPNRKRSFRRRPRPRMKSAYAAFTGRREPSRWWFELTPTGTTECGRGGGLPGINWRLRAGCRLQCN